MKGISIAMETVVYIILAVTVLTVLLHFFITNEAPADAYLKLKQAQIKGCQAFAYQQKSCQEVNFPEADELRRTCETLKEFQSCKQGTLNSVCFVDCCRILCG